LRVKVKICGITRAEDALAAVANGADAIGLVFYAPSARNVSISQAVEIIKNVPAFVSVVGLFVDADPQFIKQVLAQVQLTLLQFHGDETPLQCAQYGLPFIKAIRVKTDTNLLQYAQDFSAAKGLLLDTYTDGVAGGTGHAFDWNLIPQQLINMQLGEFPPVILAGGLTKDNVADAIMKVRPYAVDVSGGVEISKGIKDVAKMNAFVEQVNIK